MPSLDLARPGPADWADVLVSDPHTTAGTGRRREDERDRAAEWRTGSAAGRFCGGMHTSSTLVLVIAVFAASLVEMVEALTIVVAAGVSRGWRSALEGAAAALVVLGVLVVVVGVPLIRYIPHRRPAGHCRRAAARARPVLVAQGDPAGERPQGSARRGPDFRRDRGRARRRGRPSDGGAHRGRDRHDGVGFAVAFKGVFLEGTEVVLIVVSLGAAQHRLGLAALAAAAAAVLVAVVGLLVARQLSEVPENTIKTVVGVMLTSFGVFWVGEGAGVHWPGRDLAIPVLVGFFVVVFFAFTALHADAAARRRRGPERRRHRDAVARAVRAFGHFWWDFLVGDTPELALATGAIVGLAFLLAGQRWVGAILLPLVAAAFLFVSTYRGRRRAPRS